MVPHDTREAFQKSVIHARKPRLVGDTRRPRNGFIAEVRRRPRGSRIERGVEIIPLLAWYDYSFGEPNEELRSMWMDYRACRWPSGYTEEDVAAHFASFNDKQVSVAGATVITYSHFLPRIDLMPEFIPR